MANFIGLVYATLKSEGIDTAGMSTDEAVAKYNELQKEGGGKAGEKEGTPAENRKLEEKGYTFKKNTKNGEQIVNKYQQDGETHIIAKAEDGSFVVGYNYNEDKGTFENSAKFSSMGEAEQAFRKNNPNARLTEQNLSKGKKQSLVDTEKIDKTISKLEEGQKSKEDVIESARKEEILNHSKPTTFKDKYGETFKIEEHNGKFYYQGDRKGSKMVGPYKDYEEAKSFLTKHNPTIEQDISNKETTDNKIKSLENQENDIRQKMTELYKEHGGFARRDKNEVVKANQEWLKMKSQADDLKKERLKLLDEQAEKNKTVENKDTKQQRPITSTTYERWATRKQKEVGDWLGGGLT